MSHPKDLSRPVFLPERPSGCVPGDEPEHGTPPVGWDDGRVVQPKTDADQIVDEASEESFPASDPPAYPSSRTGKSH